MSATALAMFAAAVVDGTALVRVGLLRPSSSPLVETVLAALFCSGLLFLGASLSRLG